MSSNFSTFHCLIKFHPFHLPSITFSFFKDPVEATDTGTNATVAEGAVKSFSCPVDGNPEPKIEWYEGSEASGKPISIEKVLTVEGVNESVCYTCVASNSLGTPVSISQCLVVGKSFAKFCLLSIIL